MQAGKWYLLGTCKMLFLEAIKPAIATCQANAMLGEGSMTRADTFIIPTECGKLSPTGWQYARRLDV